MLTFNEVQSINAKAAAMRGAFRFQEAIELIEQNLAEMTPEDRAAILPQLLYAANEGKIRKTAEKYLPELAAHDPDLPTVAASRKQWGL